MKTPELVLAADNGRSTSIGSTAPVYDLGRPFVYRELGILDATMSGQHCQVRWRGRNFWIRDGSEKGESSLLGTFLDGRQLPPGQWVPIPRKGSLRLGGTILKVSYENEHTTEYDLMISYSRKDEKAVLDVYDSMLNLGLRPWLDQKSHQPASHFKEDIEQIIMSVKAVAVFWGGDSMGKHQRAEVEIVTQMHIARRIESLFLVVLPESEDPKWNMFLGGRDGLFLDGIDYYDMRRAGLRESLLHDLGRKLLSGSEV